MRFYGESVWANVANHICSASRHMPLCLCCFLRHGDNPPRDVCYLIVSIWTFEVVALAFWCTQIKLRRQKQCNAMVVAALLN